MEFDEISFESKETVKKPISDITYHFDRCIQSIGSFRNKTIEKINKYKHLFSTEFRRPMSLEELEEMGRIVFSINAIWNSFGSLLMPIKGLFASENGHIMNIYRELIKCFESSETLVDDVTKLILTHNDINTDEKIMSEFMISSSCILNSVQTLLSIKQMTDLDDIWYMYREFCFQNISDFMKGDKELYEEFDKEYKVYSGKSMTILRILELLNSNKIPDDKIIYFIIAFINAYLYVSYNNLKHKTVEMYKGYKDWSIKKENILLDR